MSWFYWKTRRPLCDWIYFIMINGQWHLFQLVQITVLFTRMNLDEFFYKWDAAPSVYCFLFQSSKQFDRAALRVMGGVHTFGAVRLVPLFTTRSINVRSRGQSRTQASTHTLSLYLLNIYLIYQSFYADLLCESVKQNTWMIQKSRLWTLEGNKKM